MALPADISIVTVTGTYIDGDGFPESGFLTFRPSVDTVRDPANNQVVKLIIGQATLDGDGKISIDLVATDDPDIIPTNWYYIVTERISGRDQRSWYITLSSALTTIDIADIPEVTDPSAPSYPAVTTAVTSVVGLVGDVTGAEILADPTVTAALDAKADDSELAARVPYTGASTDVDLNGYQLFAHNLGHFEGALTDPVITDNGDGTIDVSSVECMMRTHPTDPDAHRVRVTVPALTAASLTPDVTNYLVADYGAGTPYYEITLDSADLSLSRVPVARMFMESGVVICKLTYGAAARSTPARHLYREALLSEPTGARRESGLVVSESPTRVITVSAGIVWFVLDRKTLDSITMGDIGVESELIHHAGGVWTRTPITQYNNQYYDDGTDLVDVGNNKYAVNWIFRSLGAEHIGIVLGTASYTLSEAIASTVPTVPSWVLEFCWLAGRVIVEKGASSASAIETNTAGSGMFSGTPVTNHNDLDGLQGGTNNEYYHLTAAQHDAIVAGYVPYTGATAALDLDANSIYAQNLGYSEGTLTDPAIADAAGSTVTVASCEVIIRSDSAWGGDGKLYRMTVPATSSLALTDDAVNYIYVTWNSGSPIYAATTDKYLLNGSNLVPVARVAMDGGDIEYQMPYGYLARGALVRTYDWIYKTSGRGGVIRESGLGITESATRVITVAAGYAWFGILRSTLASITNGVSGATMHLWYHSAGVWAETSISQYNNSQYDNGTDLVALTPNRYTVNWIYRSLIDPEIDIVLGQGDYTLAQAEASTLPPAPEVVSAFHVLVGRIIVKQGASTATAIESVTTNTFNQGAVSDHEDLTGLQGGITGEHYHLTSAQHTAYGTATMFAAGTPASSGATGTAGQVLYDADYIYVCVATNTWKRTPLSTF